MVLNIDNNIRNSDWTKRTFDFPGVVTLQQFIHALGLPDEPGELRVALAKFNGLPWVEVAPDEIREAIVTAARVQGVPVMREHDITAETRDDLSTLLTLHNQRMLAKGLNRSHRTTLTTLLTVFERGLHDGGDDTHSRSQWAYGRVDAFLHLLEHHEPENPYYTVDNDLLPDNHPKKVSE